MLKLKGTDIVQRMTEFFLETAGPYAAPCARHDDLFDVVRAGACARRFGAFAPRDLKLALLTVT